MSHRGSLLKLEGDAAAAGLGVRVYSEIGPLREVLVHAPGAEVDCMPPAMMEELLFDDIIYGPRARAEHALFCAVLESFGVVVRDTQALLVEALAAAPAAIPELLAEIRALEGVDGAATEALRELPALELAAALVEGVRVPAARPHPSRLFHLGPIPNLLFSRDAQIVLGRELIFAGMRRRARWREPLLSRFVFRHHPRFQIEDTLLDFAGIRSAWSPHSDGPSFEGGDLLIFHEGVLLVGVSERTMEVAVDLLAEKLRAREDFHTLIMVPLPRTRSVMHLDTIFTRISEDECLVYPPMVLPGHHETLSVIRIDLRDHSDWGRRHPSLLDALRCAGVDLRPVCCGGAGDYIRQSREQWTDGANSFAIRPGVILIYSRNAATADELVTHGYEAVPAASLELRDGRCADTFAPGKRYAILLSGEELSRARGGPRCMTMPLVREAVV